MSGLLRDYRFRRFVACIGTVAGLVGVVACGRAPETAVSRLPVLKACVSAVQKRIDDAPRFQYSVRYVPFDDLLREAPVVGFVEITSSSLSQEELIPLARGFTAECLARYADVYDVDEPGSVNRLAEFLGLAQERRVSFTDLDGTGGPVDPNQVYVTFEDGRIRLFFNIGSR